MKKSMTMILTAFLLSGCTTPVQNNSTASVIPSPSQETEEMNYIMPAEFSSETETALRVFDDKIRYFGWNVDDSYSSCEIHTHTLTNDSAGDELFWTYSFDESDQNDVMAVWVNPDDNKIKISILKDPGYVSTSSVTGLPALFTHSHEWLEDKMEIKRNQEIVIYKLAGSPDSSGMMSITPLQDVTTLPSGDTTIYYYAVSIIFK